MPLLTPKRTIDDPDMEWGICVWQLPHGGYVQDDEGNYLSAGPAKLYDKKVMENMVRAARSLGLKEGKPFWLPGFRKITTSEWEDQMERLMDGKVPDAADLYRQATGDNGKS